MPERADEPDNRNEQFVRLLTQVNRRVYSFILSLVPHPADADEIQQETNVRLWRDFDKYIPGTDFGTWAMSVAKFQVMTYRKRARRNRALFTDATLDQLAAEAPELCSDERHQALMRCISKLPPKNRDLIAAYYAQDSDRSKIAAGLGRSVNALHNALSRIRRALRDCVARQLKGSQ